MQGLNSPPFQPLVDLIRKHLLGEFRQHGIREGRTCIRKGIGSPQYYDPWWFPVDPADQPECWGLLPTEVMEFESLCEVYQHRKTFQGFRGTIGACPQAVFVIGERPSWNDSYAGAVTDLVARLELLEKCPEVAEFLGRAPGFHVTDAIKIRGSGITDNLPRRIVELSVKCLCAEFQLLQPVPMIILPVTKSMARRRAGNVVRYLSEKLGKESCLDEILRHPMVVTVPHWTCLDDPHEWPRLVAEAIRNRGGGSPGPTPGAKTGAQR